MLFHPASGVKARKGKRAVRASLRGGRRAGFIDAMDFRSIGLVFLSSLAGDDERDGMAWWRYCLLEI